MKSFKQNTEQIRSYNYSKKLKRIYVNTLIPYFEFKSKKGKLIKPVNCCVML